MASKKKSNQGSQSSPKPDTYKTYFVIQRGGGSVHVSWCDPASSPPTFGLNYIDSNIAPKSCEHRVVAYHVGHDHGYGYRHRHHYKDTQPLDDTHVFGKCAQLFVSDVCAEAATFYNPVPACISVSTLMEVMN